MAEDFSLPIGDTGEDDDIGDPLLVTAAYHVADNGSCPVALTRETPSGACSARPAARATTVPTAAASAPA